VDIFVHTPNSIRFFRKDLEAASTTYSKKAPQEQVVDFVVRVREITLAEDAVRETARCSVFLQESNHSAHVD
jgi:hypothetical protein